MKRNKKAKFGQIRNSFIRIYDNATEKQVAKYELEEDFSTETAIDLGNSTKKMESGDSKQLGKAIRLDCRNL
jgi:stress response protein SCP2